MSRAAGHPRRGFLSICALLSALVLPGHPSAEPSPAAVFSKQGGASEYWDLTIRTDAGYRIAVRFLITNEGPSKGNAVAVGHVIPPQGEPIKFSNGRLRGAWDLSKDRLRVDIGRSHLYLKDGGGRIRITKPDATMDLSFDLNALRSVPPEVTGNDYRIDLLALESDVAGKIQLEGMESSGEVRGRATLTHTILTRKEASISLRRIEVAGSDGDTSMFILDHTRATGSKNQWLAILSRDCRSSSGGDSGVAPSTVPISSCDPSLSTTQDFELSLAGPSGRNRAPTSKKSYWFPPILGLKSNKIQGQVTLAPVFLRHDPLDDLPAPMRFLARFTTSPRREWSIANIGVTIPANSGSTSHQFQGTGIGSISYLNPLRRSKVR
jgi:hypothetical protein